MKKHLIRLMNMFAILAIGFTLLFQLIHGKNFDVKEYLLWLIAGVLLAIVLLLNELNQTYLNRKVAKKEAEMKQMKEYRCSFLEQLRKDLESPFEAIMWLSTLGMERSERKKAEWDLFSRIRVAGKHTYSMLGNLTELSQLETGKLVWKQEEFTMRELLTGVIDYLYPELKEKDLELVVHLDGNPDQNLLGDKLHLSHILYNLFDNAIKFSRERQEIEISLDVVADKGEAKITFSIRNNGVGFTEEFIEKVMTENDPLNRNFDGTNQGCGTGLALTKGLLEQMNGELLISGKKNDHALVTASVSCAVGRENPSGVSMKGLHIVVADGNQKSLAETKKILEDAGADGVIDTASLVEAVEIVMNEMEMGNKVDLVLFDREIKDMDVLKAAQTLRDCLEEQAPTICITAYRTSDLVEPATEAGVSGLIQKPFGIEQFSGVGR